MIREWLVRIRISAAMHRLMMGAGIGREEAERYVHEDLCTAVWLNVGMLPQGWASIPWPAMVVRQYVVVDWGNRVEEVDAEVYERLRTESGPAVIGYGRYIRVPIHIPGSAR